jgi:hypothetical protein
MWNGCGSRVNVHRASGRVLLIGIQGISEEVLQWHDERFVVEATVGGMKV